MITCSNTGLKQKLIDEIIYFSVKNNIEKSILFGSRARGDYKKTSDIDLAVTGGDTAGFALDVDEETSTLLRFDVVDMQKPVSDELMHSIRNEGVVIYEKV